MGWTEITAGAPELTLNTNGLLEWNTALQIQLGNPTWVNLMWDPDERRLGLRGVYAQQGLPVYAEPDKSEYKIDSPDLLTAAGITVDQTVSAAPDQYPGDHIEDSAISNTIFYITLP